jgi:hypothetical protein
VALMTNLKLANPKLMDVAVRRAERTRLQLSAGAGDM